MSRRLLVALVALLSVSGCGVADPYAAQPRPHPRPRPKPEAAPIARPRIPAIDRGARGPAGAVRAFALAYTNWTWRTIRVSERRRLALAAGRLRAEVARDVAATEADATLVRDRAASRGEVVAVTVTDAIGYAIVRQTSSTAGLEAIGDTTIVVYRAHVARRRGLWFLTSWAPLA